MLKRYDQECQVCGFVDDPLVECAANESPPLESLYWCDVCEANTPHKRLPSLPAQYLGDRVRERYNPRIVGGRHDTEGCEREPSLPDAPGGAESQAKQSAIAESVLSAGGTRQDAMDAIASSGVRLTKNDYQDHFESKSWKEAKAECREVRRRNAVKKLRSRMIDRRETTLRDSPVSGDSRIHKQGAT